MLSTYTFNAVFLGVFAALVTILLTSILKFAAAGVVGVACVAFFLGFLLLGAFVFAVVQRARRVDDSCLVTGPFVSVGSRLLLFYATYDTTHP